MSESPRESQLEACIVRLLGTCELNLDEIEEDTRQAIAEALALVGPKDERPESIAESLTCDSCDANADSLAQALKDGWMDLSIDEGGLSWNFLGTCPSCWKEQRAEEERLNREFQQKQATETAKPEPNPQKPLF